MSYLVSDYLINPVLRQARRFSRPNQGADRVPISVQTRQSGSHHEGAIEDITENLEGWDGSSYRGSASISGEVLTSSPIAEDGGLEAELEAVEPGSLPSAPIAVRAHHSLPTLPVIPLRSESGHIDIPGRFRTSSTNSAPFNTQSNNELTATMSPAEGPSRLPTLDLTNPATNIHHRNSSLPEDDGMGALRQQIITIQSMDAPAQQKARLMHQLLTRGHREAQKMFHPKQQPIQASLIDMISQERPEEPGSLSSFLWQMNGTDESVPTNEHYIYHLSPNDLQPTYMPPSLLDNDEDGDVEIKDVEPVLGCPHYRRNVKLQCSDCARWYTCRLCHDEVEDHILNRNATKNMLCMICGCAQRAGEFCVNCGERSAWYYCSVCKLWDNDSNKSIYHCNDCGICRKGRGLGKDFFHCKTCGTCMSMAVEKSHKCIERVSDCDCPICGEYMFTSPSPVVFMLCGHGIHKACYDQHMKSSYKCPICSKSMINMETQFRNLDRAIDSQPMPPQFQDTKAMVSCNDCYAKSAVKYHWLGLKCAICDSYNTAQLSILSDPAVEVPVLENRESESNTPADQPMRESTAPAFLVPGAFRSRRHSSHVYPPSGITGSNRFTPYPVPQRIGRSLSPAPGRGYFDEPPTLQSNETDGESVEEDDLDFWGRDPPRSVTSAENPDPVQEMGDQDDSDSDSDMNDCEEDDADEVDQFELLGHR